MSEVKVNKISPRTNCGTTTLGDSGDTFTIPSGVTISNSGTASGFGSTGEVSWNTTKITADPGPAVSGVGYFTDTSGGAFNVTLPSSPSAGAVIAVADYANNWSTANVTILRNGSNIEGEASNFVCNQNGSVISFVYVDATKGWICTTSGNSDQAFGSPFLTATGGTITTSGNCKIHTFTGPGTFTVCSIGGTGANNVVSYVVVGGGGAGGLNIPNNTGMGGGGGAGGYREAKSPVTPYTASPLDGSPSAPNLITVSAQSYPITVGAGGAGITYPSNSDAPANPGNNSVFDTITSAGGGGGGNLISSSDHNSGANGGSGGGSSQVLDNSGTPSGGSGNTPPVSPPQGQPGGGSGPNNINGSGGGGGAGGAGANGVGPQPNGTGGAGGAGVASSITGSPVGYAGGGGGAGSANKGAANPVGGGGRGMANPDGPHADNVGQDGTANTGGGGGGMTGPNPAYCAPSNGSFSGGSGIVIIRYKFQ